MNTYFYSLDYLSQSLSLSTFYYLSQRLYRLTSSNNSELSVRYRHQTKQTHCIMIFHKITLMPRPRIIYQSVMEMGKFYKFNQVILEHISPVMSPFLTFFFYFPFKFDLRISEGPCCWHFFFFNVSDELLNKLFEMEDITLRNI